MTTLQKPRRSTLPQDMLIVKHFRKHLRTIAETRVLDLLYLAETEPIVNEDACKLLGIARTGAWRWLSGLTELGLLEKVGNTYRTTEYARELVASLSAVFRGAVKGEFPESIPSVPREVVSIAREGVEALYERGRLTQEEHRRRLKLIDDVESSLGHL